MWGVSAYYLCLSLNHALQLFGHPRSSMTGSSHVFQSAIPLTMILGWGRSPNIQVYSRQAHLISVPFTVYQDIFYLQLLQNIRASTNCPLYHPLYPPPANFSPLSQKPVTELANICNWQREEDDEKTLVTMDHFMKE